jgi:hypothetical protein
VASVQERVLGVEEEIRGTIVEGVPDLCGPADLLTEDSDSLVITDIKASRGKWSQEQVEDSGEQLLLCSHLASEISPGKKIATRFLVLTKTREPQIEEHFREVEPAAVKRALAGVERVWRAIESGVFYPGAQHDDLRFMQLSGCVSGVGWVTLARAGKSGMGLENLCRFF